MYLTYGSGYVHSDGEVELSIDKATEFTDWGEPFRVRHTWTIKGQVQAATPALVANYCRLLELGYSVWYRDAVLWISAGVPAHSLPNSGSLTGVRVVKPPHYPVGQGAEGTTFRNYVIVLEAEYPLGDPSTLYVSFQETVSMRGGGPVFGFVPVVNGDPQKQLLYSRTPGYATQQGQAVGWLTYPPIPPPIWPGDLIEEPVITPGNAQELRNGTYFRFPVSWAYSFGSAARLAGVPNQIPPRP
jgi:hypothetical protein